jgi:hypothetical protein
MEKELEDQIQVAQRDLETNVLNVKKKIENQYEDILLQVRNKKEQILFEVETFQKEQTALLNLAKIQLETCVKEEKEKEKKRESQDRKKSQKWDTYENIRNQVYQLIPLIDLANQTNEIEIEFFGPLVKKLPADGRKCKIQEEFPFVPGLENFVNISLHDIYFSPTEFYNRPPGFQFTNKEIQSQQQQQTGTQLRFQIVIPPTYKESSLTATFFIGDRQLQHVFPVAHPIVGDRIPFRWVLKTPILDLVIALRKERPPFCFCLTEKSLELRQHSSGILLDTWKPENKDIQLKKICWNSNQQLLYLQTSSVSIYCFTLIKKKITKKSVEIKIPVKISDFSYWTCCSNSLFFGLGYKFKYKFYEYHCADNLERKQIWVLHGQLNNFCHCFNNQGLDALCFARSTGVAFGPVDSDLLEGISEKFTCSVCYDSDQNLLYSIEKEAETDTKAYLSVICVRFNGEKKGFKYRQLKAVPLKLPENKDYRIAIGNNSLYVYVPGQRFVYLFSQT